MHIEKATTRRNTRREERIILVMKENKKIKNVMWNMEGGEEILRCIYKKEGEKFVMLLVYTNKKKSKNKEIIEKWLEEDLERKIIIGDFNARTRKREEHGIKKEKEWREKSKIKR